MMEKCTEYLKGNKKNTFDQNCKKKDEMHFPHSVKQKAAKCSNKLLFKVWTKQAQISKAKKRKFVEFAKSECAKVGSGMGDQQVR